jgi:hypothetical protein
MPQISQLDNTRKEVVCALARAGMTGRWIAAYLGCDESTLRHALDQDDIFRDRYLQARAQLQLDLVANLARAAAKSWRASVWLLERLFPQQFSLRKNSQEPQLDELGFPIDAEASPHKPEAPARTEASPTTDHRPSAPDPMDTAPFDSAAICQLVANSSAAPPGPFWENPITPSVPILDFWASPPPMSPKP